MPWFYQNGGDDIVGPISRETLQQLAADGEITPNTQVSESETAEPAATWVLAHSVSGLSFGPRRPRQQPEAPRHQPARSARNLPRRRSIPTSRLTVTFCILGAALAVIGGLTLVLRMVMRLDELADIIELLIDFAMDYAGAFVGWGLSLLLIAVMWENVRATRAVFWVLKDQHDSAVEDEELMPPPASPQSAQQLPVARRPVERHPLD